MAYENSKTRIVIGMQNSLGLRRQRKSSRTEAAAAASRWAARSDSPMDGDTQMTKNMKPARARFAPSALVAAMAVAWGSAAIASEIDVGNPDLKVRWDNTIRYNLG